MSDWLAPLVEERWPRVESASLGLLILPLGSLEQHGPHLPMGTDAVIAGEVARRVHELRPGAGLAPTLPYGASGEHADFPGTLSLGTEALARVVVELVRDASRFWPGVLVVNGHGGNLDALTSARRVCEHEGRLIEVVHLGLAGMDAHAGHAETSMMLALAPAQVRQELAVAGPTQPVSELGGQLSRLGVRAVSPSGVLGDPRGASAVDGDALLAGLTEKAARAYDALLLAVGPPR
jgi:creatinine amidohydrolase